jgi:hypothetical protein
VKWTGFDLSRLLVPGYAGELLAFEKAWVPSVVGDLRSDVHPEANE